MFSVVGNVDKLVWANLIAQASVRVDSTKGGRWQSQSAGVRTKGQIKGQNWELGSNPGYLLLR